MTSVLPMSLHDFIGEAVSADLLKSISKAPTQQIMKDLSGPQVPTTPVSNRCEDDEYELVNEAGDFSDFVRLK
jgi:hypothetical protein